jgi:hypothetical protein
MTLALQASQEQRLIDQFTACQIAAAQRTLSTCNIRIEGQDLMIEGRHHCAASALRVMPLTLLPGFNVVLTGPCLLRPFVIHGPAAMSAA